MSKAKTIAQYTRGGPESWGWTIYKLRDNWTLRVERESMVQGQNSGSVAIYTLDKTHRPTVALMASAQIDPENEETLDEPDFAASLSDWGGQYPDYSDIEIDEDTAGVICQQTIRLGHIVE